MRKELHVLASSLIPLIAPVVFLSMSGCYFSNPQYPATWPPLPSRNDVESRIEGSYECWGEVVDRSGNVTKAWISQFLVGDMSPPSCDFVGIRHVSPNEIEVRFMLLNSDTVSKIFRRDSGYVIEDNRIRLRTSGGAWKAEGGVTVHETIEPIVATNVEGDLIINARTTSVGLLLAVPLAASEASLARFKRR